MPTFPEVYEQIGKMAETRQDVWQDDAWKLAALLRGEVDELSEQLDESAVTGEVTPVALELADVLNYALRLCHYLGFDPVDLLVMKNDRNSRKFPDFLMSKNGRTPEEAMMVARQSWKAMGGDEAWSHAFLDFLGPEE